MLRRWLAMLGIMAALSFPSMGGAGWPVTAEPAGLYCFGMIDSVGTGVADSVNFYPVHGADTLRVSGWGFAWASQSFEASGTIPSFKMRFCGDSGAAKYNDHGWDLNPAGVLVLHQGIPAGTTPFSAGDGLCSSFVPYIPMRDVCRVTFFEGSDEEVVYIYVFWYFTHAVENTVDW